MSEYCIPFVKIDGKFISYKAGNIENEVENAVSAVEKLGGKLCEIVEFSLRDTTKDENIIRNFVVINKEKSTSNKYPRKAGIPSKEPLG